MVRNFRKPLIIFSPKILLRLPVNPDNYMALLSWYGLCSNRLLHQVLQRWLLVQHFIQFCLISVQVLGSEFALCVYMCLGCPFGPNRVQRVIFCSGKHYYALDGYRKEKKINNVAIIRLEVGQSAAALPSFDFSLSSALVSLPFGPSLPGVGKVQECYWLVTKLWRYWTCNAVTALEWVWSQEEPANKGPWTFIQPRFAQQLGCKVGRPQFQMFDFKMFSMQLSLVSRKPYAASAVGVTKIHHEEVKNLLSDTFSWVFQCLRAAPIVIACMRQINALPLLVKEG